MNKKEKEKQTIKCPKCRAYFVEEGKLCNNCKGKEAHDIDEDEQVEE